MDRVEQYIQDYTRKCSNEGVFHSEGSIEPFKRQYIPWLTPDHARAVAQIARKEVIEKAVEFLKSYRREYPDGSGYIAGIVDDETINDFEKYVEESV